MGMLAQLIIFLRRKKMSKESNYPKLRSFWFQASKILNIEIINDFSIKLESGERIQSILLVKGYGSREGMLILPEGIQSQAQREELLNKGFGYTKMYEPLESEDFDIGDYEEILEDWGKTS